MDTNTPNPTEKELLDGLLDKLLKNYKKPEEILGEQGLLKRFSKAILERALGAELTDHLGYEKHDPAGYGSGKIPAPEGTNSINSRNLCSRRGVATPASTCSIRTMRTCSVPSCATSSTSAASKTKPCVGTCRNSIAARLHVCSNASAPMD